MTLRPTIIALGMLALAAPAARAAETCGPHQHLSVEKNDEEGGTVKRCVCDDGWNAEAPGAPCRKVKAAAGGSKSKK